MNGGGGGRLYLASIILKPLSDYQYGHDGPLEPRYNVCKPKYKYAESMRRNAHWKWLDQAAPVPSRAENEGSGINPR